MRIIPDGTTIYHELVTYGEMRDYHHDGYKLSDTIEITDEEWNEIFERFELGEYFIPFSQYLRELIELKRIK